MNGTDESVTRVDLEVDCRGLLCPLPARQTEKALDTLQSGEVACVRCTDPAARIDLAALCARSGDRLLRTAVNEDELRFWIRRR